MKNILKKILENKKIITTTFVCIALFSVGIPSAFAVTFGDAGNIALGGVGAAVSLVLGLIAFIITTVVGLLITLLVAILVQVAQYNGFINAPIVTQGWTIIRDMSNMFFILVLLIIAFATILRMESYNWKKMLPKLLIMAVLINFSRTIFGLIIDFSQVVMLTFVNAFANGGGWFIQAFNTNLLLSIRTDGSAGDFAVTTWSTAVAIIAGVIAAVITLIVVAVMLAVLVMRIIMIWIYTIFSPLVFLGFAVPAIQKYTGRIWEDFIKQVIVGPVLAFFLWLALTAASTSSETIYNPSAIEVCVGVGKFFCQGSFMQFIIVIGILMGGLMVTQQMGGAIGKAAGFGEKWSKTGLKFAGRKTAGMALTGASKNDWVKDRLGSLGGSRIPVLNNLATRSLIGLDAMKKAEEEKAQKYVSSIKDTRILARLGNQAGYTPWKAAVRDAAQNKMPTGIRGDVQGHVNGMGEDDFNKLGLKELAELGRRGIALEGVQLEAIRRNRAKMRAFNEGVHERFSRQPAGTQASAMNWVRGIDRNGRETRDLGLHFDYGNVTGNNVPNFVGANTRNIRGVSPGARPLAYRMTGDAQRAGSGSLSVNRFGKGKDNTIGVDLNKLGLEFLKGQDLSSVNGINTMDKGQIAEIAKKMVGVLDQEIHKLEGGSLTKGEEKKLANMRSARERLQDPSKIDNISLINTGSKEHGSLSEMGRTKVHEEIHGFGVRDEDRAEAITQEIDKTRQYSKRKEMALKDVVEAEEKEEEELIAEYSGGSQEVKNIINNISSNNFSSPEAMKDLVFYIKQLNKTMANNTGALGRFSKNVLNNANSSKVSPLEVKVIADKIKKSVNKI